MNKQDLINKLKELNNLRTGGDWTWEPGYYIGTAQYVGPTVYANRINNNNPLSGLNTHGMNLFGRLDVDSNGTNNLNHICYITNHLEEIIKLLEQ